MTVLGHWMIVLAAVVSGVSALAYGAGERGRTTGPIRPSLFVSLSLTFVLIASAALLVLLITHDFTNSYVYSYSDRSLPFHYLISAFYAGQEGSFLFWAVCSGILALVLRKTSRQRNMEAPVMAVFMAVQTIFLVLVLAKSPFHYLWEVFPDVPPGTIPDDGRGLNALLQNFWMVIHPPVLFLGFAATAAPFSLAMAGLWRGDFRTLTRQGFSWVLFATSVLGAGIMLGGYWAYGVLGWGGYWGWDPVENSSLVPWLTGVALLHTMLAQLRTGKFVRTNMALALGTFLLVVYSTFLTRSGILGDSSVHAFTDPGSTVYWLLLGSLSLVALSSVVMLALRWRAMAGGPSDTMLLTRESALGAGMLALVLSAAVVLFGTSLPIFSAIRVEPSFYDATNLPIAIAMVLLIGLSLHMQWEFQDGRDVLRRTARGAAVSFMAGAGLYLAGVRDIPLLLLALGSIFAIAVNVEIALKVARGDWTFLGGKIAHVGIALFLLGVIATGRYATTERLALPLNEPQQALGRTFTFTGTSMHADGKTGFSIMVEQGDSRVHLEPVMFSAGQQGIMKNPDIASSLARDLYIAPLGYDPPEGSSQEAYTIGKGESVAIGEARVRFVGFDLGAGHSMATKPASVGSVLEISRGGSQETVTPKTLVGGSPEAPVHSKVLNAGIQLVSMNIGMGQGSTVTVQVDRPGAQAEKPATIVVEASVKPFVNLLWAGTLVMLAGFVLAIVKRARREGH